MTAEARTARLVGLDLGQQRDYTAISVAERVPVPTGERFVEEYHDRRSGRRRFKAREKVRLEYRIRHLERPRLGTPYTKVVKRVIELVKRLDCDGQGLALVVDATGVGRPVMDMLWRELKDGIEGTNVRVTPCPVTITGGDSVTRNPDGGGLRVPKRDLVSAALVLMQNEQLKISDALKLKDALVQELLNFRVKIDIATAHDSYEA